MTRDLAHSAADELHQQCGRVLLTGAAGFIGSHLLETLLVADHEVVALDNFATGHRANLDDVRNRVGASWSRLKFIEGDIRDPTRCNLAMDGIDVVLHQAALGSVPRSIEDPRSSHATNVEGFLNLLEAARNQGVRRFVYASSSSVYGDHPALPKREAQIGRPLSPYAATKRIDEIYAQTYFETYGLSSIGLRYFNVFGPRQDPNGPYAAVVPRWLFALLEGKTPVIFGDGKTSRDFCPVANVVQANLKAACAPEDRSGRVYNVALAGQTTLLDLFAELARALAENGRETLPDAPEFSAFRAGDVRHSRADIAAAQSDLGYAPDVAFRTGIERVVAWALNQSQGGWPPS